MTREKILMMAVEGKISWLRAADILRVTPRHLRRIRRRWERDGALALVDRRQQTPRRKRIPMQAVEAILKLRRERYAEFSVAHFYNRLTEEHGIDISYTWTKVLLQNAGLAPREALRGSYRRKRERRPMAGMMLHIDGSTHPWIEGLPSWDLIVVLDDATSECLYMRLVPEEGTQSTLQALEFVLEKNGRFCELYSDRGSHFCRTSTAGEGPDDIQNGQVFRALQALGIKSIWARSPQARGRSERYFQTIQGRLPQELKLHGIKDYDAANAYLEAVFRPDMNKRFTVKAAQPESAFLPLVGVDLKLLLSVKHERVVKNDNTVSFGNMQLQLTPNAARAHWVRCPVTVHEFPDGTLGVSYMHRLIGRFNSDGTALERRLSTAGHS